MRASATAAILAAAATVASAQSTANGTAGTANSPLEVGQQFIAGLSPSCQSALSQLILPGSAIGQCLEISNLLPVVTTNASIIDPLETYIEGICSSNPCSNETLTNFTQTITQGCSSDFQNYSIDPEYFEFAVSQYSLAREVLCLNTTTPEADPSILPSANQTTNSTGSTSATINATSSVASILARQLASSTPVSAASSALASAVGSPSSTEVAAATSTSAAAASASSAVAGKASPSTNSSSTTNGTESTNTTLCPISILGQIEEYLGVNLTTSFIFDIVTGSNRSVLDAFISLPPAALCDDCIFGAIDLVAESWPAVVNITVAPNVTIAGFLNETCEATPAPYNVTYDGDLPDTINATAYNSTYLYNVTSFGNNRTTNETAPTGLPDIPVFANSSVTIQTGAPSSSAAADASMTSSAAAITSAPASAVESALPSASNLAAVKARWFGRE